MVTIEFIEGEPADALAERANEDASYHSRMINLAVGESDARTEEFNLRDASHWTRGVRDARHAAAEIALEADTRIAELEAQSERRRVLLEMSDARVCRLWERIRELEAELADCDKAWRETGNRAEKAEAEAGRLRAALEMVEWADTMMGHPNCPWCHAYENEPHEPDCARQVALGHAEQDGGKD